MVTMQVCIDIIQFDQKKMEPDDSTTHRKEIDSICLILNGKMSHLLTTENWKKNSCNILGSQQIWQRSPLSITVLFVSNWQFFAKFHIAFCLFTFQCGFPISSFMERQFQRSNQKHFIKGKSLEKPKFVGSITCIFMGYISI